MNQLPNKEQLTKGITRLTNIIPQWPLLIDPDTLDCRWWNTCVLGQIFGHFDVGLLVMRMSYQDAVDEGFILNIPCEYEDYDKLYEQLNDLWLQILEERKQ